MLWQMPKLGLAEGQIESQNPDFVFHSNQDQKTQNLFIYETKMKIPNIDSP